MLWKQRNSSGDENPDSVDSQSDSPADESPSEKEVDTSHDDARESDDDEDIIINKQARKGAKRCIESDDDDEASSDDDIIVHSQDHLPSTSKHEQSSDDVTSPRKKKKYTRIKAPVESSLETEYSYSYTDDDDDGDGNDGNDADADADDDNDDDDHNADSQSSNSSDGSESETDSNSSADEHVTHEMAELKNDPLFGHVWGYIYYMVMKATGEEVKDQLDITASVQFVKDQIQAVKAILESAAWDHDFKDYLESMPNFKAIQFRAKGVHELKDCEVCNRSRHPCEKRVTLEGYPYDKTTFEETDVAGKAEYMYLVGKYCYKRIKLYHKLFHWPYHIYKIYERKLEKMKSNPDNDENDDNDDDDKDDNDNDDNDDNDKDDNDDDKDDRVDKVINNRQTIIRHYQELKQIIHKVNQDYMDGDGRRVNKRWERDYGNYVS